MNNTSDSSEIEHYFEMDFTLMAEEIWIIVSAFINTLSNLLQLYCFAKLGLKCTTYVALFNLAIFDVIQLLTCPAMYKMFSGAHDLMEEFEAHSVFTNMFYCAMYGSVLCYILMTIKAHLRPIERGFLYAIVAVWFVTIAAFVTGYLEYQIYFRRAIFAAIYVALFAVLVVTTLIEQMASIVNLGAEKSPDHRTCIILTLFFITARIGIPIVIAMVATWVVSTKILGHVLIGLVQYVSIANLLILQSLDLKFKNVLYDVLRIKLLLPGTNVNFVNLRDETVNILNDE